MPVNGPIGSYQIQHLNMKHRLRYLRDSTCKWNIGDISTLRVHTGWDILSLLDVRVISQKNQPKTCRHFFWYPFISLYCASEADRVILEIEITHHDNAVCSILVKTISVNFGLLELQFTCTLCIFTASSVCLLKSLSTITSFQLSGSSIFSITMIDNLDSCIEQQML